MVIIKSSKIVDTYSFIYALFSNSLLLDDEDDYDADCEDIDSKLMPPPPPPSISTTVKKDEPSSQSTNGKNLFTNNFIVAYQPIEF